MQPPFKDDSERLSWLETQEGTGLISDDMGRWAVSGCGTQNLPNPADMNKPFDFAGTFYVDADEWRDTIRDAIDAYYIARGKEDEQSETTGEA